MTIQHAGVQPPPVPPVHKCESIVNCQRPRLRVSRYLLHLQERAILGGAGNTQAIACFLCSAEPVVCTEIVLMAVYSAFAGSLTIILHNKRVYATIYGCTVQDTAKYTVIRHNKRLHGAIYGATYGHKAQYTAIRRKIRLYGAIYGKTYWCTAQYTGIRRRIRLYRGHNWLLNAEPTSTMFMGIPRVVFMAAVTRRGHEQV